MNALLVLLLALGASPGRATRLGPSCDLAVVGAPDVEGFLRFDRELRAALTARDAIALTLLVDYPLTLDHPDGAVTSLENPRAVQTRFEEAFPRAVRTAVLGQDAKDAFCNWEGIMYGDGDVWVAPMGEGAATRYRVTRVSVPGPEDRAPEPAVDFVCDAAQHRLVIDATRSGAVRLRVWNQPRPLTGPPDVELTGSVEEEGRGACASAAWTFKGPGPTYVVAERSGCDGERAPEEIGDLRIATPGKPEQRWPCW